MPSKPVKRRNLRRTSVVWRAPNRGVLLFGRNTHQIEIERRRLKPEYYKKIQQGKGIVKPAEEIYATGERRLSNPNPKGKDVEYSLETRNNAIKEFETAVLDRKTAVQRLAWISEVENVLGIPDFLWYLPRNFEQIEGILPEKLLKKYRKLKKEYPYR